MKISVVIPLLNESESLVELVDSINEIMSLHNFSYEIILIDDGSNDNSWNVIENLAKNNKSIKGIKFEKNYGKSQALHAGFNKAVGELFSQWMLTYKMTQVRYLKCTKWL